MKKYITLTPVGPYFFGGLTTFGDTKDGQNYLVKSLEWPQQSAVLGLMRYLVLKQKGLLESNDTDLKEKLIGKSGFNPEVDSAEFGEITSISPAFLTSFSKDQHDNKTINKIMFPVSAYYGKRITEKGKFINGAGEKTAFDIEDYDAKKPKPDLFVELNKMETAFATKHDYPFRDKQQVGITKITGEAAKDDAFYKQTFKELRDDMALGFWVETVNDIFPTGMKEVITFGGEKSQFMMEVFDNDKAPDQPKTELSTDNEMVRFILLSDTWAENKLFEKVELAVTDTVPFQCIIRNIDNTNYYNEPDKSTLRNLLKRGSVLWVKKENKDNVQKMLELNPWQTIGYNHFLIK